MCVTQIEWPHPFGVCDSSVTLNGWFQVTICPDLYPLSLSLLPIPEDFLPSGPLPVLSLPESCSKRVGAEGRGTVLEKTSSSCKS